MTLDDVPGLRDAVNAIAARVADFTLAGTRRVPQLNAALQGMALAIQRASGETINAAQNASVLVGQLDRAFPELSARVQQAAQDVQSLDLSRALSVIETAGAMLAFTSRVTDAEQDVRRVANQLVAEGALPAARATALLTWDTGSGPGGVPPWVLWGIPVALWYGLRRR